MISFDDEIGLILDVAKKTGLLEMFLKQCEDQVQTVNEVNNLVENEGNNLVENVYEIGIGQLVVDLNSTGDQFGSESETEFETEIDVNSLDHLSDDE